MYIRKIISFEDSWAKLDNNIDQVDDIRKFIGEMTLENIRNTPDRFRGE